jgi:hypothetical protein
MAWDAIEAVLSQQRADGFIPHTLSPAHISGITQPPILAWTVFDILKGNHWAAL